MIIRMKDLRASGACAAGARRWFHHRNLDWHDFLKNGIEEELFLSFDDAVATRIVKEAHGRL